MILQDFWRALSQFGDPRFRRVLVLGVVLAIALLVAFYAGFLWLIEALAPGSLVLPVLGEVTWVGDLLSWLSLFFMLFLSMFLMIPVASAITSLFLDDVAEAVEAVHYPRLPPLPRVSLAEGLRETVSFLALLIAANIALLFVAFTFPIFYPIAFYLVNGWLLGREYFHVAALRREGHERAVALRRANAGQIWAAGCLMALPLSIPLINLLIPVIGAATFTHLYHRVKGA